MVALRKESVDRNRQRLLQQAGTIVALRKESVDRNSISTPHHPQLGTVALRKESVDRNITNELLTALKTVALRKESVDRNNFWLVDTIAPDRRSPQGERG